MNVRFLGRNDRLARLAELHRAAEEGGAVRDIDPDLRAAFDADRQLIDTLGDLASRSMPAGPAIGRAKLLAAVAARNSQSPDNMEASMIGRLLTGRGLALIATAGIFAGGAATVGASGGVGGAADHVSSILQAAHITSSTSDATATSVTGKAALSLESTATPGAEPTETAVSVAGEAPHGCTPTVVSTADTGTPEATNTPAPTTTAAAEESGHGNGPRNDDCDVRGIPTTNPHFEPAAEGTCEKGQSAVKTTPSGIMVNVPCQALDHGQKEATPTPADGTATPAATASGPDHGNGNGGGNGNKGGNSGDHSQAGDHRP